MDLNVGTYTYNQNSSFPGLQDVFTFDSNGNQPLSLYGVMEVTYLSSGILYNDVFYFTRDLSIIGKRCNLEMNGSTIDDPSWRKIRSSGGTVYAYLTIIPIGKSRGYNLAKTSDSGVWNLETEDIDETIYKPNPSVISDSNFAHEAIDRLEILKPNIPTYIWTSEGWVLKEEESQQQQQGQSTGTPWKLVMEIPISTSGGRNVELCYKKEISFPSSIKQTNVCVDVTECYKYNIYCHVVGRLFLNHVSHAGETFSIKRYVRKWTDASTYTDVEETGTVTAREVTGYDLCTIDVSDSYSHLVNDNLNYANEQAIYNAFDTGDIYKYLANPGINEAEAYFANPPSEDLSLYVGVNERARKVTDLYVGVNGRARKVTAIYVGVNGRARKIF